MHARPRRAALRPLSRCTTLSLALLLLAASALHAQQRVAPGPVVLNIQSAADEAPVPGVAVYVGGRYAVSGNDGLLTLDGMPAGTYRLLAEHYGFERHEREVSLPPGAREPIVVALMPVAQVKFAGRVTLDGHGGPVAGARITMTPVEVRAAVQGRYDFIADINGEFTVLEAPPGAYRLELAAPGCLPRGVDLQVAEGMEDLQLSLSPETAPASMLVSVRDAVTGAAVPNAWVTLAEAWPRAVIARADTGGDGNARMADVQTGRLNWETMTEAQGFAGVWFTDRGALEMRAEGNAVRGRFTHGSGRLEGTVSGDGKTLTGRWAEAESYDGPVQSGAFTFTLADDARSFGGKWGRGDAEPAAGWNGARAFVSTVAVAPSEAMVYVMAEGYEASAVPCRVGPEASVTVRMNPARLIAEREPNNDVATAQEMLTGAPVQFALNPAGDHDWFRFRLGLPTFTTMRIGPGNSVQTHLHLFSPAGDEIAGTWNYRGVDVTIQRWLGAGQYLLRTRGDGASEEPMTLRVMGDPACDVFEPNETVAQARPVQPGRQVRGYLAPPGDVDTFRFEARRPSLVRLSLAPSELQRTVALLDHAGETITTTWNYHGILAQVEAFVQPGHYHAQVSAGNQASQGPYSLWVRVIEDDGLDDAKQSPGRIATPRVLTPGSVVASSTFPPGDADYYRIPIPGPGRLHLHSVATVQHDLHLLGPAGEELTGGWNYANTRYGFSRDADGPTTWYVRARASGTGSTTSPHIITARFEPCDEIDNMGRNDTPSHATPMDFASPMRGSLFPVGDADWYSLDVDHPGLLRVRNTAPVQHDLHVFNARAEELTGGWDYANRTYGRELHVTPGVYLVRVRASGTGSHSGQYELRAELVRAEPVETVPLAQDPLRQLKLGEAQTWRPDHPGDVDRFAFAIPQEAEFTLHIHAPVQFSLKLTNALTGEDVISTWDYGNRRWSRKFSPTGPTQYRLELSASGAGWTLGPGHVMVALDERQPTGLTITPALDPTDPTNVTFTTAPLEGFPAVARVELDATGDGAVDAQLPPEGEGRFRYPAEGLYRAVALIHGADGVVTRAPLWVEVQGPRERTGVVLMVDSPSEGQVVEQDAPASARAMSYSGARMARVEATLDGRPLPAAYSAPYSFAVPWRDLTGAEHVLRVTAVDAAGERATVERRFRVSEYFDLAPNDGAVVTGNQVRVSWNSGSFTPTVVRYRQQGQEQWQQAVGESGRRHAVLLRDLEAGVAYEFQPAGAEEPGPVRTVTRVKGLAFGSAAYGPTINRDYDQRFPISVRNHAEQAMMVRLVAGNPGTDELLVGFVEEGTADRPFELAPGEERHFVLSLNAQDANRERYRFPVRIQSDAGYADEAEVNVAVRLPKVDLAWEELGPATTGLGVRLKLINNGDSLTDLTVRAETAEITLSPSIEHGMLPAGHSVELTAYPRLHDGFQSVTGALTATAVGQSSAHEVTMTVPEGQSVFLVMLTPEAGAEVVDPDDADLLLARAMSAAYLNPDYIRPSDWTGGMDTTGDGKVNRWVFVDERERILWVGEDTVGDGQVDYVSADVGFDGQFDYAAIRGETGWEQTNLLDAWLEMNFTLPWARSTYEPHDVDLVMSGVAVGSLRDTLPEGNFRFPVPPTALRFNAAGSPEGNVIEVRSRHLRGGHYVINNDFQIKTRVISTPVWTVAESREAAEQTARRTEGLLLSEPDYSVASEDLRLSTPEALAAGAAATLTVPVRNLGVAPGGMVAVALSQSTPQGADIEIARHFLTGVPVNGVATARFSWNLAAGNQRLKVTVDPDVETKDANRANNEAFTWVEVPGDDGPPTVEVISPAGGAGLADPVVSIRARAQDDVRIARVDARVDGGAWTPLAWDEGDLYSGTALVQPGARTITVRATDGAGNAAEAAANVTITATAPTIEVLAPAPNSSTEQRRVEVRVRCVTDVTLVAVRVNEGPWQPLPVAEGMAAGAVALRFGENVLEVKAVGARGVERVEQVKVTCTTQRPPDEPEADPDVPATGDAPAPAETVEVDGFGPRDIKDDGSKVNPPAPGRPRAPAGGPPPPFDPGDEAPEVEEPEPPELPDDVQAELDALEGGGGDEEDVTTEAEEFDAPPPEEWDEEEDLPLDELLSAVNDMLMDYLRSLADQLDPAGLSEEEAEEEEGLPPGIVLPPSGLSGTPPRGRAVGVQRTQRDWYCTNRPDIKVPFQLPDWLKRLNLPKPGTEKYEAMVAKMLQRLRDQGIDTAPFERFHEALRRRAGRLDAPEDLPPDTWTGMYESWLRSMNITGPPPRNEAELRAWREAMTERVDAFWLRLLASGDPSLIYDGLKARGEAFGKFDEALQLSADAALTEIKANQKLTEEAMRCIPTVGTALDILILARREDLSGEKLTMGQAAFMIGFRAAFALGPKGIQGLYNKAIKTENGRMFFQALGEMGGNFRAGGVRSIARVFGYSEQQVRNGFAAFGDFWTRKRTLTGGWEGLMGRQAQAAGRNFVPLRAGQAAIYQQRIERRYAEGILQRMERAAAAGNRHEFRRLAVQLQANKTAQALINTPAYSDALRSQAADVRERLGRIADRSTARAIQAMPPEQSGLQRVLQRNPNVRPENVVVRARTISGRRPEGAGTSFGRDRDVWYEFVDRETGRRLGVVHHNVSGPVYNQNITRITGRSAKDLDHTVTSWWHPHAYATGRPASAPAAHEAAARHIADGCSAGRLQRARDVADTARDKPGSWFRDARSSNNPITRNQNMREGMRETLKEYERHVAPHLRERGLGPDRLPPRLRNGLDIFQQVQNGVLDDSMTPEQGMRMLDAMGATPEKIAEDLAQMINFINVWGL